MNEALLMVGRGFSFFSLSIRFKNTVLGKFADVLVPLELAPDGLVDVEGLVAICNNELVPDWLVDVEELVAICNNELVPYWWSSSFDMGAS